MDGFSTRELAIGIWVCVLVVFALSQRSVREIVPGLLKAAFAKRLRQVYAATVIYIVFIVVLLSSIGLWNLCHLKNTVIWATSVALVSMFRLPDEAENFSYLKKAATNNFKLIVVIEFIISSYTFSIWIELLLIPFVTLLAILAEISKENRKPKSYTRSSLTSWLSPEY